MNGIFFLGIFLTFITLHIYLQTKYQSKTSFRFHWNLALPELIIAILSILTNEIHYFLNFLFSYLTFFSLFAILLSVLEKRTKERTYIYLLFLLLYSFFVYASNFRMQKISMFQIDLTSILSIFNFLLLVLISIKKEPKEKYTIQKIFLSILLILLTILIFFLRKVLSLSPIILGMICALPKVIIAYERKEKKKCFPYFIKEESLHFFILAIFDLSTKGMISTCSNPYLIRACHFGIFTHILLFFPKEKIPTLVPLILLIGGYFFFFFI